MTLRPLLWMLFSCGLVILVPTCRENAPDDNLPEETWLPAWSTEVSDHCNPTYFMDSSEGIVVVRQNGHLARLDQDGNEVWDLALQGIVLRENPHQSCNVRYAFDEGGRLGVQHVPISKSGFNEPSVDLRSVLIISPEGTEEGFHALHPQDTGIIMPAGDFLLGIRNAKPEAGYDFDGNILWKINQYGATHYLRLPEGMQIEKHFGSREQFYTAFDRNGEQLWQLSLPQDNQVILVNSGQSLWQMNTQEYIRKLDPDSGQVSWEFKVDGGLYRPGGNGTSSPMGSYALDPDGWSAVVDSKSILHLVDPDGKQAMQIYLPTSGSFSLALDSAAGLVFVGIRKALMCFDTEGRLLASRSSQPAGHFKFDRVNRRLILVRDGQLYSLGYPVPDPR